MTDAPGSCDANAACDVLIEAGWVVPVEPHGVVLQDHAVAVRDGAIVALLPVAEARARFAA
jgi:5-methylthioadenosine/S-adenosylhomocysteine deaminase